jgi:V/A-type H+/Na+-transporting ATPase subunit I
MAKVALQKVRVTGLKKHYKILMQELHRKAVMHITREEDLIEKSQGKVENYFGVFDLARIQFALDFLQPFEPKKSRIASLLNAGKLVLTETEAKDRLEVFAPRSESVIHACEVLEDEWVRAKNELEKIAPQQFRLRSIKSLGAPIQADYKTHQTHSWIASGEGDQSEKFWEALSQESPLVDFAVLSEDKKTKVFRITAHKKLQEIVSSLINTHDITILELESELGNFFGQSIAQAQEHLQARKEFLEQQIHDAEKRAQELAQNLDDLRILFDYNSWRKTKNDLQSQIFLSERVFAFEAWMPADLFLSMEKWIKNSFVGEVSLEKIEKNPEEIPPVLLKNTFGAEAFEPVTDMYSMPGEGDTDPTRFVALSFTIFFGLCLSDVGYGLILSLLAGSFLWFGQLEDEVKKMFRLVLACGLAAILGGVLLGGYFGVDPALAPGFLLNEAGEFRGQVLNPTQEPIQLLSLALGLGLFHLLLGVLIRFATELKNKNYVTAFADSGVWFLFLCSILILAGHSWVGVSMEVALWGVYAMGLILILTQGRAQKNWILKILLGVYALYDGITSYLSNFLSYARLMALAIATGVVALVMNTIALMLYEMIPSPIVGALVAVFILLFGHFLNFALSLLGAFIHTARLHFIEFFDKFYVGGGEKFKPFKRVKTYLFFRSEKVNS